MSLDDDLVATIYRVSLGETTRDEVFGRLTRAIGADGGVLMTRHDQDTSLACRCLNGYDDSVWNAYAGHFAAVDPLAHLSYSGRLPDGRIYTDRQLIPPKELQQTEFYQGFWRPNGIAHSISGWVTGSDGWKTLVVLTRGGSGGPFDEEGTALVQACFRHLMLSFRIERELHGWEGKAALERVAARFRLTAAEVRVVELLGDCGSLPRVADRLGRSYSTVRAQLHSVYAKTGAHGRVALLRLIHDRPRPGQPAAGTGSPGGRHER
jgi:DNA-binding CsgD family transcriptional regulator